MKFRAVTLLIALALALAGCGGNGNGDDASEAVDGGGGGDSGSTEVDVTMVDIAYEPDSASVPSGETLVVNLTNEGELEHDFELEDGSGSGLVDPGASETVEVGPFTESTVAYCTVPGHREAGMEFEINVE